ncbi:SGNH/GDSL hydrolase family protein [Kiritimatiellaeota bacterium B1221]|nr:SGNH/GDSL hydrolase family protein [Kiritimatiellaeota bacterium B1221]
MTTALLKNQHLLFIGDSITDCGRRDKGNAPLGCGYVNTFANLQTLREPAKPIRISNTGIGGNTAEDLYQRWQDDALLLNPDWLAVKIGINDCNRFLTDPKIHHKQSPEAFQTYLHGCLRRSMEARPGLKLLLITPFYLSRDLETDTYRGKCKSLVGEYQNIVKELAKEFNTRLLDTQAIFDDFLEHHPPSKLSQDMVHLNELGALILAEGVYTALRD